MRTTIAEILLRLHDAAKPLPNFEELRAMQRHWT